MADHEVFELTGVALQSGVSLPRVELAYKTYGELNPARDNAVLMPTYYGADHVDTEAMIGAGRALDPARYFIVVPNLLGNGLSSSPSNTPPPFDRAAFPNVTVYDNVACQHRLVREHLGIDRLRLVTGFSMGAQRAFPQARHAVGRGCRSVRRGLVRAARRERPPRDALDVVAR